MASVAEVGQALALTLSIVLVPTAARAQSESAAQVLFEEGRRLMTAGDVAAGCAKLAESQRLDPAGGTLLNLAACHERLGKTATAWAEFNDALAQAKRDGRDDRVLETTRRIDALTPRLSRLTVDVESAAPGLEVRVDGTSLGSASWGTPIPVDPGDHELRASAPGTVPWGARVTIAPAAAQRLVVPPLTRTAATPIEDGASSDAGAGPSTGRIVALSVGGLGLVALGVGTYFGLVAAGKKNDSEKDCSPRGCTAAGASLLREANTSAWASNIGFGVGVASLAVATVLFLTADGSRARARSLVVSPLLGAQAAGLGARGAW